MPDVKIKGYSGAELEFKDVPKVWLAAPESTAEKPVLVPFTYGEAVEGVEVTPDFSEGDMNITLEEGLLAKSAVIKKPEGLVPENIKKDTSVAGIVGEYEGDIVETEAVTVDADFSGGDMVVEPSGGKLLERATITKPETLIPENVAEGVDIAGVIGSMVQGKDSDYNIFIKAWTAPSTLPSSYQYIEVATITELEEAGITVYSKTADVTNHLFTIVCAVNVWIPSIAFTLGMEIHANVPGSKTHASSDWKTYPPYNGIGLTNYNFGNSYGRISIKPPATAPCSLDPDSMYGLHLSSENGLAFYGKDTNGAYNPRGKYLVMVIQHKTMSGKQLYSA